MVYICIHHLSDAIILYLVYKVNLINKKVILIMLIGREVMTFVSDDQFAFLDISVTVSPFYVYRW